MRQFKHIDASSVENASRESEKDAMLIAGGTDLLGTLKDEILPDYPRKVVNLKTIEGLGQIEDGPDSIKIGALATLDAVANHTAIREHFPALADAAAKVSGPTVRHMATLGGNICQMHRCWYFRAANDRFHCFRKGGKTCPACVGDARYHSIFGHDQGCIAGSPHDTAPALIALGATLTTNRTTYSAEDFFAVNGERSNVLQDGEVLTNITVPKTGAKNAFSKYALRKTIDFPIVNCAVSKGDDGVKIVCGGVYPRPIRMKDAEAEVSGGITEQSATAAAEKAVADATPLDKNAYKVEITKSLIKKTLLAIA